MSAARTIYRLAGVWNEHWGRIKTIAFWLFGAGAVSLVVGGFLVNRYGAIGAVAIIIGSLCLLGALAAFLIQRFANRRQPDAELRKLYGLEESDDPLPPIQVAPLRLRGTRTYPL